MDELSNDVNYSEMRAELQALRKKLEDLESKQAAFKINTHPTVRRRFPRRLIIASIPLAVLVVVSGLLWGQGQSAIQALFIDKDGNARFNGTVGINRGPISNQHLVITPTKGNIPFNVTDPANSINWLSVFDDGNVIMNGGNVGIGTTTPTPGKKLDVVGDARVSASLTAGSATVGGSLTAGSATVTGSLTAGSIGGDLNLGNSALYFTKTDHDHSGIGNTEGYAAIENSKNYDALMILGRTTSTKTRVVGMWDRVGIGKGNPSVALDVDGDGILSGSLFVTGTLAYYWGPDKTWKHIENRANDYAGSYTGPNPPSDTRLKTDLYPIPSALEKVSQLRGVTFRWNEQGLQYLTRDIETTLSAGPGASDEDNRKLWQAERDKRYQDLSTTSVGVIAQDVEAVLPEAVTTDGGGYKSVRYNELIPLLIEAIKELETKVKDQSQLVAQQQQEIARLTTSNLAAQQQLAELAAVKAQVTGLEAAVQRVTATQLLGTPDAVARLSGPMTH